MDIPFVVENNRIEKEKVQKELALLDINDAARTEVFAAIYNPKPRGVLFENKDLRQAQSVERALAKLGIPYRLAEMSEFA
jgi:uncharacterized protein YqjF (DUF2071 family)